jgi:hypothetical protein
MQHVAGTGLRIGAEEQGLAVPGMLKIHNDRVFLEVDVVEAVNQSLLRDPLNPRLAFVPRLASCSFPVVHARFAPTTI